MMKKGKLTVVAGPMFSGKTTKLVAMVNVFERMGFRVLTVKPSIDTTTANYHKS
jgi:thymidine kinase